MSYQSPKQGAAIPVRPALVTTIAVLELAAAAWDSRCFLKLSHIFPVSWSDGFTFATLLPALLTFAAIFAGVGLLQMRRSAWTVWMVRHTWLSSLYVLSIPTLLWKSMFIPGLSIFLAWRLSVILFSVIAGVYLYSARGRFTKD